MSTLRRISLAVFLSFPPSCSGLLKVHFKRPVSGTPNITVAIQLHWFPWSPRYVELVYITSFFVYSKSNVELCWTIQCVLKFGIIGLASADITAPAGRIDQTYCNRETGSGNKDSVPYKGMLGGYHWEAERSLAKFFLPSHEGLKSFDSFSTALCLKIK